MAKRQTSLRFCGEELNEIFNHLKTARDAFCISFALRRRGELRNKPQEE